MITEAPDLRLYQPQASEAAQQPPEPTAEYVVLSNRGRKTGWRVEMTLLSYTEDEARSTARNFQRINPTLKVKLKRTHGGEVKDVRHETIRRVK